jgi:hypothetical protein
VSSGVTISFEKHSDADSAKGHSTGVDRILNNQIRKKNGGVFFGVINNRKLISFSILCLLDFAFSWTSLAYTTCMCLQEDAWRLLNASHILAQVKEKNPQFLQLNIRQLLF